MQYGGSRKQEESFSVSADLFDRITDSREIQSGFAALIERYGELTAEQYAAEMLALYRNAGLVLTEKELRGQMRRRLREQTAALEG